MCLAHDVVRDVVLCTIYNIMGMCIPLLCATSGPSCYSKVNSAPSGLSLKEGKRVNCNIDSFQYCSQDKHVSLRRQIVLDRGNVMVNNKSVIISRTTKFKLTNILTRNLY